MEDRRGELLLREVERRINQENLVPGSDKQGGDKPGAEGEAKVVNSQSYSSITFPPN